MQAASAPAREPGSAGRNPPQRAIEPTCDTARRARSSGRGTTALSSTTRARLCGSVMGPNESVSSARARTAIAHAGPNPLSRTPDRSPRQAPGRRFAAKGPHSNAPCPRWPAAPHAPRREARRGWRPPPSRAPPPFRRARAGSTSGTSRTIVFGVRLQALHVLGARISPEPLLQLSHRNDREPHLRLLFKQIVPRRPQPDCRFLS